MQYWSSCLSQTQPISILLSFPHQGHGECGGRQEAEAGVVQGQHQQDVAERGLHVQVWGHQDG